MKKKWLVERQRILKHGGLDHREAIFTTRTSALTHVAVHRARGEYILRDVDARLSEETELDGDSVCPYRMATPNSL